MIVNKLYNLAPVFLQNFVISFKGWQINQTRFNKEFRFNLGKFNSRENSDEVDLNRLQDFLFQAEGTSFWANTFKHFGFNPKAKNLFKELQKLPILEKEAVFNKAHEFCNPHINQKICKISTSGTTGQSLSFIQTQSMENKQWAVWWRHRQRHGLCLNDWMGWFGGKLIVPKNQNNPPFHRVNIPGKQVMFSPIHLNKEKSVFYYNEIKKRKLRWLHGYPSQIAALGSYFLENDFPRLQSIRVITTGAEGLMDYQKEIIFKAFGVYPVEHYGLTEGVSNISQLPDGSYSLDQDFAYTEFIPIDGNKSLCKIIGTNYSNPAFPLIRYDTGDIARVDWVEGQPKVLSIEGRADDYITLGNGNRFGPMNQIFKNFKNIREAQIYYPATNKIEVRLVQGEDFNSIRDEKVISKCIRERLTDNDATFKLVYMDKIPRTKTGKIKSVVK